MSRLSGHLSQVGALVVAVVAAAVAYSVYDAGSTTSNTDAREPVAGLVADSGDSLLSPDSDRQEKSKQVREPNVGRTAGPSSAGAVRSSWPATGPQGQLSETLLQNVSAPLPHVSAPLPHVSGPLPWRPGPFDPRALDRELHRLIGDNPLPRVPRGPAEDFPSDLPPELIKGPGAPAPKPAPASPNVPAQPGVPSPPTPVAPPPASPPRRLRLPARRASRRQTKMPTRVAPRTTPMTRTRVRRRPHRHLRSRHQHLRTRTTRPATPMTRTRVLTIRVGRPRTRARSRPAARKGRTTASPATGTMPWHHPLPPPLLS